MHESLRRTVVVLLALAVCLAVLSPPGGGGRASASAVPKSQCARYDTGVGRGVCLRDALGGLYWLGTLRGYDGVEIYCIDYRFATRWNVRHHRATVIGALPTSIGGRVGAATVAALNHVVVRHPADRADDTTAAAIGLIIRQVMGDVRRGSVQTIPGGLTVATRVTDVAFVPRPVLDRARALWDDARVHRGPWTLRMHIDKGPDGKVVTGERVTAIIRGTNGSGHPQGMEVTLQYGGFTGATRVLMADGSTKAIDRIKVGDTIANSVPGARGLEAHKVTAVIVTRTDHDYVDLTIRQTGKNTARHGLKAGAKSLAGKIAKKAARKGARKTARKSARRR